MNFPIYCKNGLGYYFKIDSPHDVLEVCINHGRKSIEETSHDEIMAHRYEKMHKYEQSTKEEFFKVFTQTNNHLIRKSR